MIASAVRPLLRRFSTATLTSRLFVILFTGAFFTYGSAFSILLVERYIFAREITLSSLGADIATAVAVLDRLPQTERPYWLGRLSRENYKVLLGRGAGGGHLSGGSDSAFAREIDKAIDDRYALSVDTYPGRDQQMQAHVILSDGQPLTIDFPPGDYIESAAWLPYVILAQMIVTLLLMWVSVRANVAPFVAFSETVDRLQPDNRMDKLSEVGPIEVVKAARALNLLIDRLDHYVKDRMQILAAVSHDLKTPLTRLRLRIETDVAEPIAERLMGDINAIQQLISEGIALAKSADISERQEEVDFVALVEEIAAKYRNAGADVSLTHSVETTGVARRKAIVRVLSLLIDNSVMFAGRAELGVHHEGAHSIIINVCDRGPGIDPSRLEDVMEPFVRLEGSRSRETGGAGIGLAIARRIALANDAELRLINREGGGLTAELSLTSRC